MPLPLSCRERGPDLFGRAQNLWRVIRTSNAYVFRDPQPDGRPLNSFKSELPTGTEGQKFKLLMPSNFDPTSPLHEALKRLGSEVKGSGKGQPR